MLFRKNIIPILTLLLLGCLALNDVLNENNADVVSMGFAPLVAAALIAGGAQVVKGVGNMIAARRQKNFAGQLSQRGTDIANKAWSERKDYQIPEYLKQNQTLAMNQMYDRSAQEAMQRNADLAAGNVASQISRSASTSGQAAAGALAAEQMRMQGYNQAALSGIQQRNIGLQAAMNANNSLASAENMAYQYNTMLPFTLNYERGINLENQGIQGRVVADQQRAAAFADMMNGLSSAAMTYGINAPDGAGAGASLTNTSALPKPPSVNPNFNFKSALSVYEASKVASKSKPTVQQGSLSNIYPDSRMGLFNNQTGGR